MDSSCTQLGSNPSSTHAPVASRLDNSASTRVRKTGGNRSSSAGSRWNRSGLVHEPVRFPPQTVTKIFEPQWTGRFDRFTGRFFEPCESVIPRFWEPWPKQRRYDEKWKAQCRVNDWDNRWVVTGVVGSMRMQWWGRQSAMGWEVTRSVCWAKRSLTRGSNLPSRFQLARTRGAVMHKLGLTKRLMHTTKQVYTTKPKPG
jgi:hypothetical protein